MRRTVIGIVIGALLALHGLAHANAGMLVDGWMATLFWGTAMVGFVAAGFGALGASGLRTRWRPLAAMAAVSSLLLFALYRPATMAAGAVIDAAVLVTLAARFLTRAAEPRQAPRPSRFLGRAASLLAWTILIYLGAVVALRPWHMRWGTTDAERRTFMPGDELVPSPHYRIDHAVTIRAPADSVWPWLAQLGQDRGGFYSYAWLERLVGDDIRNADRIHPEWQRREVGDLVRATQPDYLGGRLGIELGWRVTRLEPGRVIVLGGWGAFILRPVDEHTTRLIVRTRGAGEPNVVLAPLGLLVFEPAHFIMERGMLLGIKRRAESQSSQARMGSRPAGRPAVGLAYHL